MFGLYFLVKTQAGWYTGHKKISDRRSLMRTIRNILVAALLMALLLPLLGLAEPMLIPGELKREGLPFQTAYPDNPVIPGQSGTTGLPFEGVYAPVILVIDNSPEAHPHWGVMDADLIYQVPNAGLGATKLLALFSDKVPVAAGGSRSARTPFVDVAREWGAAFAFAGHPGDDTNKRISVPDKLRDAGMKFNRRSFNLLGNYDYIERVRGYVSPHNLSVNLKAIQDIALKSGETFTQRPFLFGQADLSAYPSYNTLEVRHYGMTYRKGADKEESYNKFIFDSTAQAYVNETMTGSYVDRDAPDSPILFANIIIQRTRFSNSGQYVLLDHLTGNGAADIFIGGHYIRGGWQRDTLDSRTVYVDDKGQEVMLRPGKTYIILTNEITRVTAE